MAWYMRGGATYEDILNMSTTEREQLKELIDSNLEVTKKSGLPFFWFGFLFILSLTVTIHLVNYRLILFILFLL